MTYIQTPLNYISLQLYNYHEIDNNSMKTSLKMVCYLFCFACFVLHVYFALILTFLFIYSFTYVKSNITNTHYITSSNQFALYRIND